MTKANLGLIRAGAASPAIKVADPAANADNIIAIIRKAAADNTGLLVLPQLTLTGSTCGDLFFQDILYRAQLAALEKITASTKDIRTAVVLGCYIRLDNRLVDCAVLIQSGNILGVVPKAAADERHFAGAAEIPEGIGCIRLFGKTIPFGSLIFEDEDSGVDIGIEILNYRWSPAAYWLFPGLISSHAPQQILRSLKALLIAERPSHQSAAEIPAHMYMPDPEQANQLRICCSQGTVL